MGIAGAAIATVAARLVEVLWCVWENRNRCQVKLHLEKIIICDNVIRSRLWKYTAPVMGNEIVWGIWAAMPWRRTVLQIL